jgi:starvation-inducible DNA-binding protein
MKGTTMNKTRIDLPESKRVELVHLLNERLADAIDLNLQTKQAHWNVKGPNFIGLHELFDKVAEEVEEHVDLIAERATTLGGIVEGTLAAVSKRTQLPAYSLTLSAGRDHVDALATALAAFGKAARAAIDKANSLGDADTADIFTEISRETDKNLWFVEAHLQAER